MRRGTDSAEVFGLAFDPVSKYLACSSDKGTIHIFAIKKEVQMAATAISKQLYEDQTEKKEDAGAHPVAPENV